MAFAWSEFLAVARALAETPDTAGLGFSAEAAHRSATSRAYYAAFCSARGYASAHLSFAPTGTGSDHSGLRRHLLTNNRHQLAQTLSRLQQWREQCDYDDAEIPNAAQMARDAVRESGQILVQYR